MAHEYVSYDPFDLDRLDRLQAERDEALGLTQHNPVPLELAADRRREMLMDALDDAKNQRAPDPLPPRLAQNLAGNASRRRIRALWDGPGTQEPVAGGARGDVTDQSSPMDPDTAVNLVRLLRQTGRPQAAQAVIDQVQRAGRPW